MLPGPVQLTRFESDSEEEASPETNSHLFSCTSCGTVYIATEKQTCSACKRDVEKVPATLADTEEP